MTQPQQPGSTPAGWYPDQHGQLRYWDGQAWTEHTAPQSRPANPSSAPGEPTQQSAYQSYGYGATAPGITSPGRSTGKIIGGVAMLFFALVGLLNSGQQTFANGAERAGYLLVPLLLAAGGLFLLATSSKKK